MKQAITSGVFIISFVSLLVLGTGVPGAGTENVQTPASKAPMGSPARGLLSGGGCIAAIGVFTADGNGNGSEVETLSLNGEISPRGIPYGHLYRGCRWHRLFREYRTRRLGHPQRFRD